MPGSYVWKGGAIQHPYGCKCRFDPYYVPCGCQGVGGSFAGPTNPKEYNEMVEAEKKKQKDAADLEEFNAAETHKENLAALEFLGDPKKLGKLTDRNFICRAVTLLRKFRQDRGVAPSDWLELAKYGDFINYDIQGFIKPLYP